MRKIALIAGPLLALAACGGTQPSEPAPTATSQTPPQAPSSTPAEPSTSTSPPEPTSTPTGDGEADQVVFTVTGDGQPDVMWSDDGGQHDLNTAEGEFGMGYAELPVEETVSLDPESMYYSLTAQLGQDGGEIECTIEIGGEQVADGSASGSHSLCTAQANSGLFGFGG